MPEKIIDSATAIRKGEELDVPALTSYLNRYLPGAPDEVVIEQFPSGFSNLTYLIRRGQQQLVLRRPPFGANIKSGHDMGREFRVLSGLTKVYSRAPKALVYCEDEAVLGAPFYVMERVQGVILRNTPPKGVDLSPPLMKQLSKSVIENLAALHQVDFQAAGLSELGKPEGYVERQVKGWSKRYLNAQTDDIAELNEVMQWLNENMPAETGACLIHNDYKYDNIVLDPKNLSKIIAVLDWEMATLGDPFMDLGTTLSYWAEKGEPDELSFGLTRLPGNLNRQEVIDCYMQKSGKEMGSPVFYFAFGLFKLAVIIQQIYGRYKKGHTQDARFANLHVVVRGCTRLAAKALDKNRIYNLMKE